MSFVKLRKKLSSKQFIISHIFILIVGLTFIFGIYYILNIQYQKPSSLFAGGPLTVLPRSLRLDLDHPDEDNLTFNPDILVSGKTSPLKEVLIFTDSENLVINSKKDGSFSTGLNLDEGENKITVVVFDSNGDTRSAERTVYYAKEKL